MRGLGAACIQTRSPSCCPQENGRLRVASQACDGGGVLIRREVAAVGLTLTFSYQAAEPGAKVGDAVRPSSRTSAHSLWTTALLLCLLFCERDTSRPRMCVFGAEELSGELECCVCPSRSAYRMEPVGHIRAPASQHVGGFQQVSSATSPRLTNRKHEAAVVFLENLKSQVV